VALKVGATSCICLLEDYKNLGPLKKTSLHFSRDALCIGGNGVLGKTISIIKVSVLNRIYIITVIIFVC
jgi:hypothetical protein